MTQVGRVIAIVPPCDFDIEIAAKAGQRDLNGVDKALAVRSQREGQEEKCKQVSHADWFGSLQFIGCAQGMRARVCVCSA